MTDLNLSGKEMLGLLSIVFAIAGYGRYVWDIIKGETKPHVFSWVVWGIVTSIVFAAQLKDDAGAGSWTTGFGAAVYFVIVILSLYRGEKDIKRSDWAAFIGALAAIPLWVVTGDPLGAVVLVTAIDMMGFYPTFRKSYSKPGEETVFMYVMAALQFIISIAALENYSITTVLYPLTVVLADAAFVIMVVWRRRVVAGTGPAFKTSQAACAKCRRLFLDRFS